MYRLPCPAAHPDMSVHILSRDSPTANALSLLFWCAGWWLLIRFIVPERVLAEGVINAYQEYEHPARQSGNDLGYLC